MTRDGRPKLNEKTWASSSQEAYPLELEETIMRLPDDMVQTSTEEKVGWKNWQWMSDKEKSLQYHQNEQSTRIIYAQMIDWSCKEMLTQKINHIKTITRKIIPNRKEHLIGKQQMINLLSYQLKTQYAQWKIKITKGFLL